MSKLPPPPLISSSQEMVNEAVNELFAANAKAAAEAAAAAVGGCPPSCRPNSSASFVDSIPTPTPPGLLQMLLNAEKSQEMIWSSVRCGGNGGIQPGQLSGGAPTGHFPYGIHRMFADNGHQPMPLSFMPGSQCQPLSSDSSPESDSKSNILQRNGSMGSMSMPMMAKFSGQWDTAHEITARLLFMVIRWIKSLPTFRTLSKKDQVRFDNLL